MEEDLRRSRLAVYFFALFLERKKKEKAQEWLRSISLPALYHTKHKMVLRSYGGDIYAKENSSMTMCCIHAYSLHWTWDGNSPCAPAVS